MKRRGGLLRGAIAGLGGVLVIALIPPPAGGLEPTPQRNECSITAAYATFLGRDARLSEVQSWLRPLTEGETPFLPGDTPRTALGLALTDSDEWLAGEVTQVYQEALDRDPEPDGRSFWVQELRDGARVSRIAARIYGSDEFYVRAGSTDEAFVEALYRRILGRSPDQDGVAYWAGLINRIGRSGVAANFYASMESRMGRVVELYERVLGRTPEPDGLSYWTDQLTEIDDVRLAVALAASEEFYTNAQSGCRPGTLDRLTDGDAGSFNPALPDSAYTIAFESVASDLVGGDTNGVSDIFVSARIGFNRTFRITDGNAGSYNPSTASLGRSIAFESDASDLVAGDTNGQRDIFVNRGTIADLDGPSTNADGIVRVTAGNGPSSNAASAAEGRFIAFQSEASDLVGGDGNGASDIFVWNADTGETRRITDGDAGSHSPSISADGRYIAFASDASDLVDDDTNGQRDIFVWDAFTEDITRIAAGDGASVDPTMAENGAAVTFTSDASDLVGVDTNDESDVFVWDREPGALSRVTTGDAASFDPSISNNAAAIAFASDASDLVADDDDTNGQTDVFLRDRIAGTTTRITAGNADSGRPTASSFSEPGFSTGGSVTFESQASDLVPGDDNAASDIFVWNRIGNLFPGVAPPSASQPIPTSTSPSTSGAADVAP